MGPSHTRPYHVTSGATKHTRWKIACRLHGCYNSFGSWSGNDYRTQNNHLMCRITTTGFRVWGGTRILINYVCEFGVLSQARCYTSKRHMNTSNRYYIKWDFFPIFLFFLFCFRHFTFLVMFFLWFPFFFKENCLPHNI